MYEIGEAVALRQAIVDAWALGSRDTKAALMKCTLALVDALRKHGMCVDAVTTRIRLIGQDALKASYAPAVVDDVVQYAIVCYYRDE
jgi:hypothetical protein